MFDTVIYILAFVGAGSLLFSLLFVLGAHFIAEEATEEKEHGLDLH